MTDRDPVLTKVKQFTLRGWPAKITDEQLQPYSSKRDKLSLEDAVLLRGSRVVVPPQARDIDGRSIHWHCEVDMTVCMAP